MDSLLERESIQFPQKSDRELLEDMQQRIVKMEKRDKRRAIFAWVLAVMLIAAVAVLVISFIPRYEALKAQYDTVAETVQQLSAVVSSIDLAKLQDAADFIGSVDYAKMVELSDVLESLDAQQLKEQLEQLTGLVDKLGELNAEDLVDNINLIIEKIQPLMNLFKR